jgi:5-methylcytosine-specific restriction protein B
VVDSELRPLLQEYWFDAPDVATREVERLLEGW